MALAFWRELLVWTVNVHSDQVDRETFRTVAGAVLAAAHEVSGHELDHRGFGAYERTLLGLGGTDA